MPIGVPPCPCICHCRPGSQESMALKKRAVKDSPALQILHPSRPMREEKRIVREEKRVEPKKEELKQEPVRGKLFL